MAYLDSLSLGNLMAIVDNLVQQFGVCGERDVLLLYGGVYEGCLLPGVLAVHDFVPRQVALLLAVYEAVAVGADFMFFVQRQDGVVVGASCAGHPL